MQPEGRSFYTERSLAAYLSVSDRLIRKWVTDGRLRSYKLGSCRRFDPADVDAFLAAHRQESG
jgi:excisionase family DNA binding protein